MKYLGWSVFYEGKSDAYYLDVLIPKILREIIGNSEGEHIVEVPDQPSIVMGQNGREIDSVATEACKFFESYEILFIHSDQGGRGLQGTLYARSAAYCEAIRAKCDITNARCICITPKHEIEAWVLADHQAVLDAVGIVGNPTDYGLPSTPRQAERLENPKETLMASLNKMRIRKRKQDVEFLFPAIANRQNLQKLYRIDAIGSLRDSLRRSLIELGFIV